MRSRSDSAMRWYLGTRLFTSDSSVGTAVF
jgi:hypothetical protein